ncbi:uncharacterized protein LOC115164532 isoform X3 [Salmo trutta]|uniref:uncharacterized protein LOC115164532 isoform X3 n=1 Tax=Salmo trutta TaxID=8032 RepID=UPI0011310E8E|nr:uncharacterized protein LOC115164532 isoform X3 [Salmo trutta]
MITDKCCNSTHTKSFHLLQLQVKMYLIVPILVSLLLPKAYSLKCFECTPGESGACTDKETDCPTQCGNTRITSYMGGTKLSDVNMKSCSVPAQCLTASVNFGMMRTMIASTCCNTDLCNSQSIPVLHLYRNGLHERSELCGRRGPLYLNKSEHGWREDDNEGMCLQEHLCGRHVRSTGAHHGHGHEVLRGKPM